MLRTTSLGIALIACLVTSATHAQVGGAPRNVGGGVGGSAAAARGGGAGGGGATGLAQTGQLDSDMMIQSSRQAFVGGGVQGNPRSLTGAGGMGGMGGMSGMGLGGMMGGMGLGGMGGMGGMGMGGMGMGGMGMGGMGMGGRGMMGQGGMMGGMGGMQGRGGMQQNRTIRTPLRIGSGVITTPMAPRVGEFQQRLGRIPGIKGGDQIALSMDGSVVVLQGTVATPRDRELAARLLMLEPGVRDVRNELVVQPDLQP